VRSSGLLGGKDDQGQPFVTATGKRQEEWMTFHGFKNIESWVVICFDATTRRRRSTRWDKYRSPRKFLGNRKSSGDEWDRRDHHDRSGFEQPIDLRQGKCCFLHLGFLSTSFMNGSVRVDAVYLIGSKLTLPN
jgi:hypothetical protein